MGVLKKDKAEKRSIIAGSGAAAADAAVEGRPQMGDHRSEAPHARPAGAWGCSSGSRASARRRTT